MVIVSQLSQIWYTREYFAIQNEDVNQQQKNYDLFFIL